MMKKFLFQIALLLTVLTLQAQKKWSVYFANNIGDVTRVAKIKENDQQLHWTEISNGMVAGNRADVQAVQKMFADRRQKTRTDQKLFWKMRDDNLLCFRINDGKGTHGEYEVRVKSGKGRELKKNVTSYFFVNTESGTDSIDITFNPKNCGPNDTIRFKYYIYDWNNKDLLLFKLDSRRRRTGLTYQLEYVMQDFSHTKESTGRLSLSGSSFQSFYLPQDSMLKAVYLVSEGKNRVAIDLKRLIWGANLSDKLNRLWLNDNFTLDKHENRELTIFNMLGSGLFEQYDTLFLQVLGKDGSPIACVPSKDNAKLASGFRFHVAQVDENGKYVRTLDNSYVGYRKNGIHKILTNGNPAYIEVIAPDHYSAVYKYGGAMDPATKVMKKERTSGVLRLMPRTKDATGATDISAREMYVLKDTHQEQAYNGESYRVFAIDSCDLSVKSSSSEFKFFEDAACQKKKLVNGKPVDKYAEISVAFSVPKASNISSVPVELTALVQGSNTSVTLPKSTDAVLNGNDYPCFERSYRQQRWNLVGALHEVNTKYKLSLKLNGAELKDMPYVLRRDVKEEEAIKNSREKAEKCIFKDWEPKGELNSNFSLFGQVGSFSIKSKDIPGIYFGIKPYIDIFKEVFELDIIFSMGFRSKGTDDNPTMGQRMRNSYVENRQRSRFQVGNEFGAMNAKANAGFDLQNQRKLAPKRSSKKWVQAELDDIMKVSQNKLGHGPFVDILATIALNWQKESQAEVFSLKNLTGTLGYGLFAGYAVDIGEKFNVGWLQKINKILQLRFEFAAQTSLQLTLGVKSFNYKNGDIITDRKYGFFLEPMGVAKLGASIGFYTHFGSGDKWTPENTSGEKNPYKYWATRLFSASIHGRFGAKVMGKYAGFIKLPDGDYDQGGMFSFFLGGDLTADIKIPLFHYNINVGGQIIGGKAMLPNSRYNPANPEYPNYDPHAKAPSLAPRWSSLTAPRLAPRIAATSEQDMPKFNLGENLIERLDGRAQPRFLGEDRFVIVHNNQTDIDKSDDQLMEYPVAFDTTAGKKMSKADGVGISSPGRYVQNFSVAKEGQREIVVYEEMTRDLASKTGDVDKDLEQAKYMAIVADVSSMSPDDQTWKQHLVAYDENVIDCEPKTAVMVYTTPVHAGGGVTDVAVCVWKRGRYVMPVSEEEMADNNPEVREEQRKALKVTDMRSFEGDLMMSVFDGTQWLPAESILKVTKNDILKSYQVVMVNDTILTAVNIMPANKDSLELRYYCKPPDKPMLPAVVDKMTPIDFSLDLVGVNPFVAILHAPDSSSTDIYVKAIDLEGHYTGYGADLDIAQYNPMSVRLLADKEVQSPEDFAVVWEKFDNGIRQKGEMLETDSVQIMLNCSRVYMRENLQATPFITLASSADKLKMTAYDVFLDNDKARALWTLTDPTTDATYLMRNEVEFYDDFDYSIGYSQQTMLDDESMPVNIYIYNTGDTPIISVEGNVNDQYFKFDDIFINPYSMQTFTIDYKLPAAFNGLLKPHDFIAIFDDLAGMKKAPRRGQSRRSVAKADEDAVPAPGFTDIKCKLLSQTIEGTLNTVYVELTDNDGLNEYETLRVGLYPGHVADVPISSTAEVTLKAEDFEDIGGERKAYVTLTVDKLDEEQDVYLRARVYNDNILKSLGEDDQMTDALVDNLSWADNLRMLTLLPSELDNTTGLPVVTADEKTHKVKVEKTDGGVWISGLEAGDYLRIFDAEAMPYCLNNNPASRLFVPINRHGVYVLSTGQEVVKFTY